MDNYFWLLLLFFFHSIFDENTNMHDIVLRIGWRPRWNVGYDQGEIIFYRIFVWQTCPKALLNPPNSRLPITRCGTENRIYFCEHFHVITCTLGWVDYWNDSLFSQSIHPIACTNTHTNKQRCVETKLCKIHLRQSVRQPMLEQAREL
jgi:hypothetical protein